MKIETKANTLSTSDFIELGITHVVQCDNHFEKTYKKEFSEDEIYLFVHHSDIAELIICIHSSDFMKSGNIQRIFRHFVYNKFELECICKYFGIIK